MTRSVVFGAGQVGLPLAQLLSTRGQEVKLVSRSGGASVPGIEAVRGDAMNGEFCTETVRGASAVYHCMNPKYETAAWEAMLPRIQENLVAAAGRAQARLVVLDNVYMLGRPGGKPLTEDTPLNPCSRKGEIRARLADALLAAHRRGDVQAVTGRASDFFGPGGLQTMFEARFWKGVLAGKNAPVIVNPDTLHTYHYIPDVAAGLAALGAAESDVTGRAWMLPCERAVTTRELAARFAAQAGHTSDVQRMPRWLFKTLTLVVPIFREFDEMLYQWEEPFVIDDQRFRERLAIAATPLDASVRATVQWARRQFG